ncbi:double-stranded RNA-binding motif protein (macronuclear) [Tetrahymena thermophila SB210]|uniref:Double-stranded RNA-binding motif protein n=1 Tax=Tetrahymena thermophila (strain SB210) TaxID=312017 RepID=Q23FX7_TETTS|nr:double-stranded RNA-binding motif protein [Tetrahymena thermophila SB210]EAR95483.2 double-stranded RNA-binding motif protein [Tetrahymena thermophila SB210]|eukprot:XP_001015728.2 double-stranded RNA-binding motif protein [Tetrahymena thermophila SB210]
MNSQQELYNLNSFQNYQNMNQYPQNYPYYSNNQIIHPSQTANMNNSAGMQYINHEQNYPQYQQQSFNQQNYYHQEAAQYQNQNMFQVPPQQVNPYMGYQNNPPINQNVNNLNQNNLLQDQYKRSETQSNFQNSYNYSQQQQHDIDPSTIGIDQQLQTVKDKEEINLKTLNKKRKQQEIQECLIDQNKNDDQSPQKQDKNENNFVQNLMDDIQLYFPQKPLSVFLREYCSKMKRAMDIICDENEKGLGFSSYLIIDGKHYPKGIGKSKKDAREEASMNALAKMGEENSSVKNYFAVMVDKEKKVHQKFKNEKAKSSSSEQKSKSKDISEEEERALELYDPLHNYREDVSQLANQVLRLSVSYETLGDQNNWEVICSIGKSLKTMGQGLTIKDAKNISAYKMIHLIEQSNEKTIKTLARKALVQQKIDQTNLKLKELQELKAQKEKDEQNTQIKEIQKEQENLEKENKQHQQSLLNTYSCLIDSNYEKPQELQKPKIKSQQSIISSCLNKFKQKDVVSEEIYIKLRSKFDLLINSKQLFQNLGLVDFCIVGSHEFRLLRKNKLSIDVILNYNKEQLININTGEDIFYEAQKILKQILNNHTIKLEEKNQKKYIRVIDDLEKELEMIIYFSDVSGGSFCNEIHHAIWFSQVKTKIFDNKDISAMLKCLRMWKEASNININTSIIDFIMHTVTHKFTLINAPKNLVSFFEFVANEGIQDIINLKNKRNIEVTEMHFEMIQKINKEDLDQFVRQCQSIYNSCDYTFMKSISL